MNIDLTIIIPTRDRYGHLLRLLSFFEKYKYVFSIIILDSSENKIENKEILYFKNKKNITWKRIDNKTPYWKKISENTTHIQTTYCTLCADDDFINPSALIECKNYLENNADFSCVQGYYYNHPSYEDYQANKMRRWWFIYGGANRKTPLQENAFERVIQYLSGNTYPSLYALHRSKDFKFIWDQTNQYVTDWNIHEFFPCSMSLIIGKMQILPILYASKEPNSYYVNKGELIIRSFSDLKILNAVKGIIENLKIFQSNNDNISEQKIMINDHFFNRKKKMIESAKQKEINSRIKIQKNFKSKLSFKSRFADLITYLLYKSCPKEIYKNFYKDYKNIKESVIDSKLSNESLNVARKTHALRGSDN